MKINYYNQTKSRIDQKIKKALLLTVLAAAAIWGFFWIPYFKISKIEINNRLIRQSQVSSALEPFLNKTDNFYVPKDNFFLFSAKDAQEFILKNDLGIVEVNKKFPNKIELKFLEIKPKFIYCNPYRGSTSIDCYYMDKRGFLYEFAPNFTENPLPLIETGSEAKVGDYILMSDRASFLSDFVVELGKMNLDAKKIKAEKDLTIFLKQGWHIILLANETRPPEEIAEKLKLILDQKIKNSPLEYIDMRFPNKAFYKLK